MSRYVVTGAAGFLGRHLVAELAAHGHDIRAMVRRHSDGPRVQAPGVPLSVADLEDRASLEAALRGAEIVCHCAARLPVNSTPEEVWNVNVKGVAKLVEACIAAGVRRIVFVSTDSVYAEGPGLLTEEAPLDPSHVYEGNYPHSKIEGEKLVLDAGASGHIEAVVIRPCLIYGPGASAGTEHFAAWAAKSRHLLIGGGTCLISTAFVTDVAAAIELAAETPAASGRVYNVTDGEARSKRQILETIARVTGAPKKFIPLPGRTLYWLFRAIHTAASPVSSGIAAQFNPDRILFSITDHAMDITRIRSELGYRPRVGLEEGLRRTLRPSPADSKAAGSPS